MEIAASVGPTLDATAGENTWRSSMGKKARPAVSTMPTSRAPTRAPGNPSRMLFCPAPPREKKRGRKADPPPPPPPAGRGKPPPARPPRGTPGGGKTPAPAEGKKAPPPPYPPCPPAGRPPGRRVW